MPAFKLIPAPTFTARAAIPIPGAKPEKVLFTFKYRDREAFKELMSRLEQMEDLPMLQEICCGWELTEPFDEEHLKLFVQHHIGGPRAVLQTYMDENGAAKVGNS